MESMGLHDGFPWTKGFEEVQNSSPEIVLICCFLDVNQGKQFAALQLQNLATVWRQHALNDLMEKEVKVRESKEMRPQARFGGAVLRSCMIWLVFFLVLLLRLSWLKYVDICWTCMEMCVWNRLGEQLLSARWKPSSNPCVSQLRPKCMNRWLWTKRCKRRQTSRTGHSYCTKRAYGSRGNDAPRRKSSNWWCWGGRCVLCTWAILMLIHVGCCFSLQASYFRRRCFSFHGLWTDREVFQQWKMAESCAAAVCWVDGVNLILSSSSAGTHHERQGKGTLRQAHRRCWWKQGWRHLACGWKLPEI